MILAKNNLSKFISELIKENKVFAPTENNGTIIFNQITKPSEMNLNFCKSEIPPKRLLFNQTETLFKFIPGNKAKIESVNIDGKNVIWN